MPPKSINVSSWNLQPWRVPAGSRDKSFVENPEDGKLHFYKLSKASYPSEFWSEIIASEVGMYLGFNLLEYNIGILNNKVGCICQSMLKNDYEELIHGINIISEMIVGFKISQKPKFSLQDIRTSFMLNPEQCDSYLTSIFEILVFDAIIGNQDRHLENWAIIRANQDLQTSFHLPKSLFKFKRLIKKVKSIFIKSQVFNNKNPTIYYKFAPIYDSGSSLGREIAENKLNELISDKDKLIKYINNGKNEIRWEGRKMSFFDLLKQVKTEYSADIASIINRVEQKYNKEKLREIIFSIDGNLPEEFQESKLSSERKAFIYELISLRIEMLKTI